MPKHKLRGIYAITDPVLMGQDMMHKVSAAIAGGITLLQYRNKTAPASQQLVEAQQLAELCRQHQVTFIVNDDIELARVVDADGVHIGQQDSAIAVARDKLGNEKIIGVSCNNRLELALAAQHQGADYIALGRFFASNTKPDAPQANLSLLSEACQRVNVPIVAIGGITLENALPLLQAGVDMLAVIQGIFAQQDIHAASQQLSELFTHHARR